MGDCLTGWVTWLVTGAWGMLKPEGKGVSRSTAFQRNKTSEIIQIHPALCADLIPVMTSTLIGLFWDLTVPYVR